MNIWEARQLAWSLIDKHGLKDKGWTFEFDNSKKTFGQCWTSRKLIELSRPLTELNDEEQVKDTILHEIAHALVGNEHGHNRVWQTKAKAIGCNGKRCYDTTSVIVPPKKWVAICQSCKTIHSAYRRTKGSACGVCCKKYNNGRYSDEYLLNWQINTLV